MTPGFVEEFPFVAPPGAPVEFWSPLLALLIGVGIPAVPLLPTMGRRYTPELERLAYKAAWVWATGTTFAIAAGSTEVQPAVVGVAVH